MTGSSRKKSWLLVSTLLWVLLPLQGWSQSSPEEGSITLPPETKPIRQSRLSQLIQRPAQLFMPSRLLIGQENKFLIRGLAGKKVMLYLSSQAEGLAAPNGQALRVGPENQQLGGVIPESGVLALSLEVPKEEALADQVVYVEAIQWQNPDYSDLSVIQLLDPSGRATADNRIALFLPDEKQGAMLMPAMPGMASPQVFQQLNNVSGALRDDRKKDLLDTGDIQRDTLREQNVFIQRRGLTTGSSTGP